VKWEPAERRHSPPIWKVQSVRNPGDTTLKKGDVVIAIDGKKKLPVKKVRYVTRGIPNLPREEPLVDEFLRRAHVRKQTVTVARLTATQKFQYNRAAQIKFNADKSTFLARTGNSNRAGAGNPNQAGTSTQATNVGSPVAPQAGNQTNVTSPPSGSICPGYSCGLDATKEKTLVVTECCGGLFHKGKSPKCKGIEDSVRRTCPKAACNITLTDKFTLVRSSDFNCCICLADNIFEPEDDEKRDAKDGVAISTGCGHWFHKKCIVENARTGRNKKECPLCRKPLSELMLKEVKK